MASSCTVVTKSQDDKFSVYCGDGSYVSNVDNGANFHFVHTTPNQASAIRASRRAAVAALHMARRAGLSAWIVPAPLAA